MTRPGMAVMHPEIPERLRDEVVEYQHRHGLAHVNLAVAELLTAGLDAERAEKVATKPSPSRVSLGSHR